MITIKKAEEIAAIKTGGKILAEILSELVKAAKIGIKTIELDELAEKLILARGGVPAFKNYKEGVNEIPFPGTICASVNNELVHGAPGNYQLQNGDILSIDIGMKYPATGTGYFTDMAVTIPIGKISAATRKLIKVTEKSLAIGISQIKEGNYISDIGSAIQKYVEAEGFSIVRQLVGHGVGYAVHEDPRIPNYFDAKQKPVRLEAGMVLAIEPMVNVGKPAVIFSPNSWAVFTADGQLCAHFEHTVAVTKGGVEILTKI
ncbi:MAG: type I methionyl aminopeptidase [Patescibacteria group bacterium]|jgi:methionyl aminopeptidase